MILTYSFPWLIPKWNDMRIKNFSFSPQKWLHTTNKEHNPCTSIPNMIPGKTDERKIIVKAVVAK